VSGSAELKWGIKGSVMDNSANFANDDEEGKPQMLEDPFAEADGTDFLESSFTITGTWEGDAVTVKAEASVSFGEDAILWDEADESDGEDPAIIEDVLAFDDDDEIDHATVLALDAEASYGVIEFGLMGGMVTISLNSEAEMSTPVTATESDTENPWIGVTIAPPMSGASVSIETGLTWDVEDLMTTMDFDDDGTNDVEWINGQMTDIALFLYVEIGVNLSDTDSITVGLGIVFDTAWSMEKTTDADALEEITDGSAWPGGVATADVETYVAKTVTDEPEDPGEVMYGFPTIPIGLNIAASVMGIEANLLFQTRLTSGGPDEDALLTLEDDPLDGYAEYAPAMHIALVVSYALDLGSGMRLTPSANFKMTTDAWKFGLEDDVGTNDGDPAYEGDVTETDFIGMMMSAGVGVAVDGVAGGMLSASLTFAVGFGDQVANHCPEQMLDTDGFFGEVKDGYAYHQDYGDGEKWGATLADYLAYAHDEEGMNILEEQDGEGINPDDYNDPLIYVTDLMPMKITLSLTLKPMGDVVSVSNSTSYEKNPIVALLDGDLTVLENITTVEYNLIIGDSTACTFYLILTIESVGQVGQEGEVYDVDDGLLQTQQASKMTVDYELGVKSTVSF
jgi:hypothetical protein